MFFAISSLWLNNVRCCSVIYFEPDLEGKRKMPTQTCKWWTYRSPQNISRDFPKVVVVTISFETLIQLRFTKISTSEYRLAQSKHTVSWAVFYLHCFLGTFFILLSFHCYNRCPFILLWTPTLKSVISSAIPSPWMFTNTCKLSQSHPWHLVSTILLLTPLKHRRLLGQLTEVFAQSP